MNLNAQVCCDGCGALATDEHLCLRVARLELATRFRPIHIDALILIPSPFPRFGDYFYKPAESPADRGAESQTFFRGVLSAAGVDTLQGRDERVLLEEFQRTGCFLASWSECPPDNAQISFDDTLGNLAPSVVRRIKFSYRPKRIIPISHHLAPYLSVFREAGLTDIVMLKDGKPIAMPDLGNPAKMDGFRAELAAVLGKTAPRAGSASQT